MITNGLGILTDSEQSPEVLSTGRIMPTEEFIANGLVHLGPLLAGEEQISEVDEPEADNTAEAGLKDTAKKFLSRFVEGDISRLTVGDTQVITQNVIQANKSPKESGAGRPQREDINNIIASVVEGESIASLAQLYETSIPGIQQVLRAISRRVIEHRGAKFSVEDFTGPVEEVTSDNTPDEDIFSNLSRTLPPSHEAIPDDWFSKPRTFGAFSLRQVDIDGDNPLAWQDDALCAQTDPEAFFPEKGGSTREAKKICTTCEVKNQCLEYALVNDERYGIWGGLSERERRRLRKSRT